MEEFIDGDIRALAYKDTRDMEYGGIKVDIPKIYFFNKSAVDILDEKLNSEGFVIGLIRENEGKLYYTLYIRRKHFEGED